MEENKNLIHPDNNLAWAILTTIFCCTPFGIVSIIYASKVDSYWARGEQEQAIRASKEAKKWAIISAVSAAVVWVIYVLCCILFMVVPFAFVFSEMI